MEVNFILPYPLGISVNKIWGHNKSRVYLNPRARQFKEEIKIITWSYQKFEDQSLRVEIKIYPPDKRKRDIDNIAKVVLDALQYAKLYNNDNQIQQLYIERCESFPHGKLEIKLLSLA